MVLRQINLKAYVDMRNRQLNGEKINKAAIYRMLSGRFGRSPKAFEYHLQNISHVYALMGRSWLTGLKPARNVGSETAAKLEELIHLQERSPATPIVRFEQDVQESLKRKPRQPPAGQRTPKTKEVVSTQFIRDPHVVVWVLQEANGQCEGCESPAPFAKPSGVPYLEVHHLRCLADGASDTMSNAAALCPNCHRELHYGQDQDHLKQELFQNVSRLVAE